MLIVANWKAYVDSRLKAEGLIKTARRIARTTPHTVVIAPPLPFIGLFARRAGDLAFAGQDVSASFGGAQTGEVTAAALKAAGATYVIIGHSERRASGETDELIAEKMSRALAQDLTPILCIGERARDHEGRYLGIVREQLTRALTALSQKERGRIVVAYEPVWAIGKTADEAISQNDLGEMVLYIRKVLSELLPGKGAGRSPILYGGSVEVENVRPLAGASGVDGFLIGHASVEGKMFSALVRALA